MLGGRGIDDLGQLREEEATVFGDTDRASTVRIRVLKNRNPQHVSPQKILRGEGRSYLWHFVQAGDNDRSGIKPGEEFDVRFLAASRRTGLSQDDALQEAIGAFWLLVHHGGLGTRNRRCAGSFQAEYISRPNDLVLPSFSVGSPYEQWMREQLSSMSPIDSGSSLPDFDHFGRALVWLGPRDYNHASQVVDEVGTAYKEFRDPLTDGQKVGFGLPIGQGTDRVEVKRRGPGENKEVDRRASPLWMQVVEDASGNYRPIFTLFGGTFLPNSGELYIEGRPFDDVFEQRAPDFALGQGGVNIYPG